MTSGANARVLVEVAVDSVAGAIAAETAGADRVELCASLGEGGLTPSVGLFDAVRDAVRIPVFVMVRPRRGDFLPDAHEFDVMLRDARLLRERGADGIVAGVLLDDGSVDARRMRELVDAGKPLPLTFHRAFDLGANPRAAIDALVAIGAARILTSGQAANAHEGAGTIAQCVRAAHGRIGVIAGGGVRGDNVREIVARTGVREVHLSASAWTTSAMTFRRAGVPMGSPSATDEYAHRTTDGRMVAAVVAALTAPPAEHS